MAERRKPIAKRAEKLDDFMDYIVARMRGFNIEADGRLVLTPAGAFELQFERAAGGS